MSLTKKSKLRSCSLSDLQVNLERMITLRVPNFSLQSSKANQVIEQHQPPLTKKVETIKNATTINTASATTTTTTTADSKCSERVAEEMQRNGIYSSPVFPSLTLVNQFKTWTIGRKLKGKLKKITTIRSLSNVSATSSEQNSDDSPPSIPSMTLPNASSSSDERDDSASSDLASGGGSTHDPNDHAANHWLSDSTSSGPSISSSPTDLEKAIESLPTDVLDKIEIVAVSLTKDERGELGIYVKGRLDSNATLCYFIADFEKNGPAERSGQLQVGDEVLMVGSNCLRGLNLDEALRFLRSIDNTISLIVARQKAEIPDVASSTSSTTSQPSAKVGALNSSLINTRRRSQYSPAPSQELNFQFNRRASYAIDSAGSTIGGTTTTDGSICGDDSPFVRNPPSMLDSGLCTVPRKPKNNNIMPPDTQSITFYKGIGQKGLGFRDLGRPIYVKTIYPNGQAAENGLLQEGDEILSINGVPTANLTHAEAIEQFKRVKTGEIVINCRRSSIVSHNAINMLKADYKSCSALDLVQFPRINH